MNEALVPILKSLYFRGGGYIFACVWGPLLQELYSESLSGSRELIRMSDEI